MTNKPTTKEEAIAMKEAAERFLENCDKPWPQDGDEVFCPWQDGDRIHGFCFNKDLDKALLFAGLLHRDGNSDDKHQEIINRMIELRGDWRPDWGDVGQSKYCFDWDHQEGEVRYYGASFYQRQSTFYMQTEKHMEQIKDEFGSDLKVLFGMSLEDE